MTDLISRQATIYDLYTTDPSVLWSKEDIEVWLNAQPTVSTDSCKGCRYEIASGSGMIPCGMCSRNHRDMYERRTDDDRNG